jgi:hypothetical protein
VKRVQRDPGRTSLTLLTVLVAVGLVAVGVAWRGVAASLIVAVQLPYAISGAMGGLALIGFALAVASIQTTRRREAARRAAFGRVVDAAADLLAAARGFER